MDQKITVPLEIPAPAQQQEKPAWAKRSLHSVTMPRREVKYAAEWEQNGPNPTVQWREVEQRAEPETSSPHSDGDLRQQVNNLTRAVLDMATNQYGTHSQDGYSDNSQPSMAEPPDPLNYDFYDPQSAAQFQADNNAFVQQTVQRSVQAAMEPHAGQLREAQLAKEYNGCVADFGGDEDFQTIMQVAIQSLADAGDRGSLREAYERAADQSAARPGKRGYGRLPTSLRRIDGLGRIMHHNQQTGRASFEKRNRW